MMQLGLEHRFQCFNATQKKVDAAAEALAQPIPPSQEWWNENWMYVNGWTISGKGNSAICDPGTKFETHWTALKLAFQFSLKYVRLDMAKKLARDLESGLLKSLANRIRCMGEIELEEGEYQQHFKQLQAEFIALEELLLKVPDPILRSTKRGIWRRWYEFVDRRVLYSILVTKEIAKLHLFERRKLRKPLEYDGCGKGQYPKFGDVSAFYWFFHACKP